MTESLYERLGGAAGIKVLVDDVLATHMENPTIKARFLPFLEKPDDLEAAKGHLRAFFAQGSGGPAEYSGRSMPDAHKGMNISGEEYLAAMDDIMGVLKKHKMSEETHKDVLAILYSLKDDIAFV